MDNLEIGMYIRNKQGIIAKIIEIEKLWEIEHDVYRIDKKYYDNEDHICYNTVYPNEIKKSSKNIIDVLEVGDLVNGQYIERINEIDKSIMVFANYNTYDPLHRIVESDIKTIVTKEQLKNIEYEV